MLKLALFAALLPLAALADRATLTTSSGGGGVLPRTAARKALAIANLEAVAICVAPSASIPSLGTPCWPLAPDATLQMDVGDAVSYSYRLCSTADVSSCFAGAGVITLEVQ